MVLLSVEPHKRIVELNHASPALLSWAVFLLEIWFCFGFGTLVFLAFLVLGFRTKYGPPFLLFGVMLSSQQRSPLR